MLKTMVDRPAICSQAFVHLLAVGMSALMIGLDCLSPLLAASQSGASSEETGLKAFISQRLHGPTPGPPATFRRAQEVVPPAAELELLSPTPAVPQPGSVVLPMGQALSEPAGPAIVGRVLYRGPIPASTQIEVDRDQDVCGRTISIVPLSVDTATHGLRNAVVHVELGESDVPAGRPAAPPVVVRNKQCRFHPHVSVAQVGNEMRTVNDDPVMHNTHITIANSTVLNVAMVAGERPIKKQLKKAGLQMIKCNVHKFMQAYRMVFDDPYFDQTAEDGQFMISGVSPGPHTITVWHETLGVMQKDVQVPVRGTVVLDLEYK
jgi:plastocyanin